MIEPKHSNTKILPLSHSQNKVAVNMRKYRKDHPEYVAKSRDRKEFSWLKNREVSEK